MTDWIDFTTRTLAELKEVDARFRPTNFWGPGLEQLLDDMESSGLDHFKSWRTAGFWFYPRYWTGIRPDGVDALVATAREFRPTLDEDLLRHQVAGGSRARRDFDAARLFWDHARWPIRLGRFGESTVGDQQEAFRLTGKAHGWTRPYLNYMLCMAALSHHVDEPPTSVLELGGGFGVLGEFLMSRNEHVRYVDLDIPPLLTVASYYLRTLFGDRVALVNDFPATGPLEITASAVLPNWRIGDVQGAFEVFVNAFSFQEMEPDVVRQYIADVAAKNVTFVVSLNSRRGKPQGGEDRAIGVHEQVTSGSIVAEFATHGYVAEGRYGAPLIHSAGELVVLRRADTLPGSGAGRRSLLRRTVARLRR